MIYIPVLTLGYQLFHEKTQFATANFTSAVEKTTFDGNSATILGGINELTFFS